MNDTMTVEAGGVVEGQDIDGGEGDALTLTVDQFNPLVHNGTLTVLSHRSGEHRTFKVATITDEGNLCGKRTLAIGDPYNGFFPFAFVNDKDGRVHVWKKFRGLTGPSFHDRCARMFENIRARVNAGRITVEISGSCRRCNRVLTHPESIETGMGPTCGKRGALVATDSQTAPKGRFRAKGIRRY